MMTMMMMMMMTDAVVFEKHDGMHVDDADADNNDADDKNDENLVGDVQ